MLKITVEVYPYGAESFKQVVGEVYVGNDGEGSSRIGSYDVYLNENPVGQPKPRRLRPGWIGKIRGFKRTGPDKRRMELALEALQIAVRG